MSVIAVKGVPFKWSLMDVIKIMAKAINGNFETLNFQPGARPMALKTCYLRLSEKLDPVRVVEKINSTMFPKKFRPFAFIPDHVPDIPLAAKLKKMPTRMRRSLKLPEENEPEKVLPITADEIMAELQSKYPGLYSLSMKNKHKLLEDLSKVVMERLTAILEHNAEISNSCFKLSQSYRRTHPHFGDFQLVLSTLHAIEDAEGTPRTQLQEKELSALPLQPYMIGNVPYEKVQSACAKYSDKISKKVTDHVMNLKSEVTDTDTEDEIVRKKVREELKKMTPFLPMIVRQVINKQFIPKKAPYQRVRVYGEPFLPGKETMQPFLKKYQSRRVIRSERMYNLMRFNVPPTHYTSLMAMDGTVLNGAKLVIRSSDMPRYNPAYDGNGCEVPQTEEGMDEDAAEDWDDMM